MSIENIKRYKKYKNKINIKVNILKIITKKKLGISIKKPLEELQFEVHLVEHCNLNCCGCDNFSPLAEKSFLDRMKFENDLDRLSAIFKGKAKRIYLLGGEPLLHPEIESFFEIARKYFPKTEIALITNGILLEKKNEVFWKSCKKNKIKILVTHYPIKINEDKNWNQSKTYGVDMQYFGTADDYKELWCYPIDLNGLQDVDTSFGLCGRGNNCISLWEGKLFTCTMIPNIRHFNKFFQKNLIVKEDDYIDIYKNDDPKDILKRLSNPTPFCKYCNMRSFYDGIVWSTSKRDIKEWVL